MKKTDNKKNYMPKPQKDPHQYLNKGLKYALVGASSNWNQYSYTLLLELEKKGFSVIPIHPEENIICGINAFPSLRSIIHEVDIVIFASSDEEISIRYLKEMRDTGLYKAWLDEGLTTPTMKTFAEAHFFETIEDISMLDILRKMN